jgi:hypothetical protein
MGNIDFRRPMWQFAGMTHSPTLLASAPAAIWFTIVLLALVVLELRR